MALTNNQILEHLQILTPKVQALYPHIEFMPVVYNGTDYKKAFQSILQKIKGKSYEKTCKIILQREFSAKHSDFLGLAIYKKKKWLGLSEQEKFIAMFSIKSVSINDTKVLEHLFWHNFSHTLDCIALRNSPKYQDSFNEGPMIPKRPLSGQAIANLKADIFATLILAASAPKHIITDIIKRSCQHPLNKFSASRAALYPLPLAIEHIYFGLETLGSATNLKSTLSLAKGLSEDIIATFDKNQLNGWFEFVDSAQEMAWMGFNSEEILSAATNTSENAHIRNISGEISEILGITPSRQFEIDKSYNPFFSEAVNSRNHFITCKETFQRLLSGVIAERSALRFYDEAAKQNCALLEGRAFGWCAFPLLEAAKYLVQNKNFINQSFDQGQSSDKWRHDLTEIFEKNLDMIRFRDIKDFSKTALSYLKDKKYISFEELHANTAANPDQSYIAQALLETCQNKSTSYDDIDIFKTPLSAKATRHFSERRPFKKNGAGNKKITIKTSDN